MRVGKRFGHGIGFGKLAPALGRIGRGDRLYLRHHLVSFRVGQHDFHAEAGHQPDDTLGNGKGLTVRRTVGPGHGQFFALEIVHTAEVMDQVQHVGHGLGGVIDVALQVDQRGALLEDPFQAVD